MSETVEQIIEKTDRVEFDSQNSMTTKINETKQPFWKVWERQEDMSIDPHDFPALKKRLILFTIAMAAAIASLSTNIYYPSLVQMQNDFHTDATTINASVSIYVFCNAVFPLVWAPFGDVFGRRRIYILSFLISMAGNVGCALSANVGMFIAFRAISSMGASSVLSMGAGTLSDIYYASERGRAMSIYMAPSLLAPAVGPIIGGYMSANLGWHSVFWFVAIYGLVVWICILFFLPETWRPEKNQELPGNEKPPLTKWQTLKQVNPIHSLRFFKYENVRLCVTFTGVCFMIFYIFNTSFTRTYTTQYHLESGTVGLCYVPYALGSFLAATVGGRAIDRFYNKSAEKAGGKGTPEMRLNLYLLGFAVFSQVAGEITYGWCTEKNLHMAIGLVCIFFIGFGIMIPNITMSTYSVDCFRSRSASITACNNFARFIMGGIGSLISADLQDDLGNGILFSICAGLVVIMFGSVIYVKKNQTKWQEQRQNTVID